MVVKFGSNLKICFQHIIRFEPNRTTFYNIQEYKPSTKNKKRAERAEAKFNFGTPQLIWPSIWLTQVDRKLTGSWPEVGRKDLKVPGASALRFFSNYWVLLTLIFQLIRANFRAIDPSARVTTSVSQSVLVAQEVSKLLHCHQKLFGNHWISRNFHIFTFSIEYLKKMTFWSSPCCWLFLKLRLSYSWLCKNQMRHGRFNLLLIFTLD